MGKKIKSVALFDLDKTIYEDQSYFGVAKYLVDSGVFSRGLWTRIEIEAKKYADGRQRYAETANNLLKIFGDGLRGKEYVEISRGIKAFFKENENKFYPYFGQILPRLRQTYEVYLVTTNSQMVAQAVVDKYRLDGSLSTQFEVKRGIFTGKIVSTLADGKESVEKLLIGRKNTLAVGDSENDIEMLERVDVPICINPNDKLREVVEARKWLVVNKNNAAEKILEALRK